MDVLSDVITAVRTGRPHSALTTRPAPWESRHQPFAGAGFHLVVEGSCCFTPPGGRPIELRAGDVVFLTRGSAHTLSGESAVMLCGAYVMDRARPHPLLDELPEVIHLPTGHEELRGAIELLTAELQQPRPGSDALLSALLDAMLLYLIRTWLGENTDQTGWTAALRDPAIRTALHSIHTTPEHPWTVAGLAHRAGLSRAAFARRFTSLVPPTTGLLDLVAHDDRSPAPSRLGPATPLGGGTRRLHLGVRLRDRLQARTRPGSRRLPPLAVILGWLSQLGADCQRPRTLPSESWK